MAGDKQQHVADEPETEAPGFDTDERSPASADRAAEAEVEVDGDDEAEATQAPPRRPPKDPRDARIETLERLLAEREATLHSYIKAHKQAEGEFEGFKTRARRDRDRELQVARGKVVERMLDVDENLERTIKAAEQGGSVASLIEGVRLVHKLFLERMAELGLERIDPTGQEFDPTSMEALGLMPVTDPNLDNKVIATLRAGFRMGDQEIRPALVQVGRKL